MSKAQGLIEGLQHQRCIYPSRHQAFSRRRAASQIHQYGQMMPEGFSADVCDATVKVALWLWRGEGLLEQVVSQSYSRFARCRDTLCSWPVGQHAASSSRNDGD